MFKSFKELLQDLEQSYNRVYNENVELRQRLREYNKDKEIQKLQDQIKYMQSHSLCHLSDLEKERIYNFTNKHYELHKDGKKLTGSTYQYTLSGTGIGTIIEIKCPICGEEEDVTDTSNW